MTTQHTPIAVDPDLSALSTPELVRQTLTETKELVQLELSLARDEVRRDLVQFKRVSILAVVALACAITTLSSLLMALVIALGNRPVRALIVAGALALLAALFALAAYKALPRAPLERTRARLKHDLEQLKGHVV